MKNLLLFFDGVCLLVPEYMRDRPQFVDAPMTTGLREHGLLTILEPESFIDKAAATSLTKALTNIIASGALDKLAKGKTKFHELSYSRLGYMADPGLAERVYKQLKRRGLAESTRDGVSIPMHPMVHSLILTLLAQILRARGEEQGWDLCPATDRPQVQGALVELLGLPTLLSSAHVVSLDLKAVGVDVTSVPLDEVLDFRRLHGDACRKYAHSLRSFVQDLSSLSKKDRETRLNDRREEISELGKQLKDFSKKEWRRRGSFALGIAGAAWSIGARDILGSMLSLGAIAAGFATGSAPTAGAYSYLFAAGSRYRHLQ